mmetsp:Transcript_23554/g.58510  ORF Transcript_23554/g.58510 Transcript_23554/m.58510 type:complete len:237 (+) Transcript_23554:258-968(+)
MSEHHIPESNLEEATDMERRTSRASEHSMFSKGRVSTHEINFENIPTNLDLTMHVEDMHGQGHWRLKAPTFLHSRRVQTALMVLLLLDILILFAEILLLAYFPHCSIIERDAISCCPHSTGAEHFAGWTLERAGDTGVCEAGLDPYTESPAGCDSHKWSGIHSAETALWAMTIAILSIFMIELNVEMVALGPSVFFRHFFFLLDNVIIAVSLTLELVLHILNDDCVQALIGLLVFV